MKRAILFICLIVVVGLLVACGNGGTDNGNEENTAQGNANAPDTPDQSGGPENINWDEHVTYTWWTIFTPPNDYYTDFNDNPVNRYLENRFNVTFDFQQPVVGTEGDSFALMAGSGRFTDVMSLSTYSGSIAQLYYDGIIIDIAEWLDYMPNLRNMLETQPHIARGSFDDNGRILTLPQFSDDETLAWAGLMYRHDILETMTDGNVQFPSGNDIPTTLADWEYMLPLMLAYFEAAGFADFAPLILPALPSGMFHWGELMSTFGGYYLFYVRDDVVHAGMMEPAMYEFTRTMREWFENGWIHQDFLSRNQDMFFMPNPPLVYGGAAGVFYGMGMHIGDRLSMPEHGMHFDIRPISSPMADGITHRDMLRRSTGHFDMVLGNAVYSGNPDIGRFLSIMDIFYTVEGGLLRQTGITADQAVPGDPVLEAMGMPEGSYYLDENGIAVFHPNISESGGHIDATAVSGLRFPGMAATSFANAVAPQEFADAMDIWGIQDLYTEVFPLPPVLSPTAEEDAVLSANEARFTDHINQNMAMFITGTAPLNEETWESFLNQLRDFGYEDNRDIWQAVYDRYLVRGQ